MVDSVLHELKVTSTKNFN